jgi:hypothetical protein
MSPTKVWLGKPLEGNGVNFAIYSEGLCLFDSIESSARNDRWTNYLRSRPAANHPVRAHIRMALLPSSSQTWADPRVAPWKSFSE